MADNKTVEHLVARATQDAEFRTRLLRQPLQVIRDEGYDVPAEVLQKIEGLDPAAIEAAWDDLEKGLGDRKAAAY